MIITYIRSSLLNTWDSCQQKTFLQYVLGLPSPSNLAACKGSICHKVYECLALGKQAIQNNESSYDAEELGILPVDSIWDIDVLPQLAVQMYREKEPHLTFAKADLKDCKEWVNNGLEWHNGAYDPRKLNILQPEKHFDIEIKENWAKYQFNVNGEEIEGHLRLRGTIDLVALNDDQLWVMDLKTGARRNWKTFKTKEYEDLEQEIQFLLYYYVAAMLYPEYESAMFTVLFVKDGGPFTFLYDRNMLPNIENRLRKYFDDIRKIQTPNLSIGKQCSFCPYSKITVALGDSPCSYYHQQVLSKGLYQIVSEFGNSNAFMSYTGGGRTITKE